jgi:hypothetical protein
MGEGMLKKGRHRTEAELRLAGVKRNMVVALAGAKCKRLVSLITHFLIE